jgi:uncharacterized protein YegP (UPF0339 family)
MARQTFPTDPKSRPGSSPEFESEGREVKFVVILELGGRWIWELRLPGGGAMCRSSMSYDDRETAFRAIQAVRSTAPKALVFDPLGTLYEGI